MTDRRYKIILRNFIADLKGENMELHAVNVGYGDAFSLNGMDIVFYWIQEAAWMVSIVNIPERVDIVSFLREQKVSRIDTLIISQYP